MLAVFIHICTAENECIKVKGPKHPCLVFKISAFPMNPFISLFPLENMFSPASMATAITFFVDLYHYN